MPPSLSITLDQARKGDRLLIQAIPDATVRVQVVRFGLSIGSILEEAESIHDKADFIARCRISLREARKTLYWLRLLDATRTGVVVTAIQGRDYARIYMKELERGKPSVALSPEEQEAVDRAMGR